MIILIWFSLALSLLFVLLFPFVFSEVMIVGLAKLHLEPRVAATIVVAVFLGGLINIPVTRIARDDEALIHPLAAYGFFELSQEFRRLRRETIVAVNVGGCLIPVGLALY